MKKKVLLFARSFLAKYYGDIKSDIIEPIFVTMTTQEREYLEGKGWKVYGCFEEEYESIPLAEVPANYLKTSFNSDRFLDRYPYEKRMEILGKEISFWSRIIDTTKPEYLINETVAIEIAEVMAIEAEKRNIPFYTGLLGFLPDTFYWKPNPFTGRLNDLSSIQPTEEQLKLAEDYIYNVSSKAQVPFYVKKFVGKSRRSFFRFAKSTCLGALKYIEIKRNLKKPGFHYEDHSKYCFVYSKYYLRSILHKYDSFESLSNRKYVYLPLHMEPEATLSYFVDDNYRQDFLIDMVMKSLQHGQFLVVKEHPQQPGLLLEPRFRELKKQYKNLVYLPSYMPSYSILKGCDCIVTLTSTAAWEGLLLKKPVLVMGKIFFDQCPGAIRINDFSELKRVLRAGGYRIPSTEELQLFVSKMISQFNNGCPTPSAKDSNLEGYVKAMERVVDNL